MITKLVQAGDKIMETLLMNLRMLVVSIILSNTSMINNKRILAMNKSVVLNVLYHDSMSENIFSNDSFNKTTKHYRTTLMKNIEHELAITCNGYLVIITFSHSIITFNYHLTDDKYLILSLLQITFYLNIIILLIVYLTIII